MMLTLEGNWISVLREMCLFLWHLTQSGRADSQFCICIHPVISFFRLLVYVYHNYIIYV